MGPVRAFVAVLLAPDIRERLATEVARLRPLLEGVAWVGPDNLHLTLKFLGGVDATRLDAIAEALKGAAVRCRPFELSVSGLGAFPTPARARVLWAGIEAGAAEATALARHVDDALVPLGCEREARAFSAHVTLGRVRTPRSNPQVAPALSGARDFGRQRVEQVALMRSELSPRGARYTELAIAPLSTGSPE